MQIEVLNGTEGCQAPCWMDVRPGVTNYDDTAAILRQYAEAGKGQLIKLSDHLLIWRADGRNRIAFHLDGNGIMSYININLVPRYQFLGLKQFRELTMQEFVERLGEPEALELQLSPNASYAAGLYFPEKGVELVGVTDKYTYSTDANGNKQISVTIDPEIHIVEVTYYSPSDLQTMINTPRYPGGEYTTPAHSQPWHGFGEYYPDTTSDLETEEP